MNHTHSRLVQDEEAPQDGLDSQMVGESSSFSPNGPQTERNRGDSMTLRDRPTSHSRNVALTGASAPPATMWSLLREQCRDASHWIHWLQSASSDQQTQVIDLIRQQGLAFGQQLPTPDSASPIRNAAGHMKRLLTGNLPCKAEPSSSSISFTDTALDEDQQQAVIRAIESPDVSLIMGFPGSGRSRVIAEILRQAKKRQQRVLFIAPEGQSIDRVLEPMAECSDLTFLRYIAVEEPTNRIPKSVLDLSLPTRVRQFNDQTAASATQSLQSARSLLHSLQHDEQTLDQLSQCVVEAESLSKEIESLQTSLQHLSQDLECELSSPQTTLGNLWQQHQDRFSQQLSTLSTQLSMVETELEEVRGHLAELENQERQLLPLVQAVKGQRWWTGAYWRATFAGDSAPKLNDICQHLTQTKDKISALAVEKEILTRKQSDIHQQRDQARLDILSTEERRRTTELQQRLNVAQDTRENTLASWDRLAAKLSYSPQSLDRSEQGVAGLRDFLRDKRLDLTAALNIREQWADVVERLQPSYPESLLATVDVVAATTNGALPCPSESSEMGSPRFDVLVVEDAHRATETDLLTLGKLAQRCVLIGERIADLPTTPATRKNKRERTRVVEVTSLFNRLWERLHFEPRRLPARWSRPGNRLVVQLLRLSSDQQAAIQREPLFDRPEIEVGFLMQGRSDAVLAEVSFPGSTTLPDAYAYLYNELQELPLHASAMAARWISHPDALTLELSPLKHAGCSVEIEPGLTVELTSQEDNRSEDACWISAALRFDLSKGWNRQRAEKWVEDRFAWRDLARTTFLSRGHRFCPELMQALAGLLFSGTFLSAAMENGPGTQGIPAIEFIAVPMGNRTDGHHANVSNRAWEGGGTATLVSRPRVQRGGAGLEVDLSDPRRIDAIPSELRSCLPERGVVNYTEARAIVSTLEQLVEEPWFQSACATWNRTHPTTCHGMGCCVGGCSVSCPAIAVVSSFPAQVELLRVLISRSQCLSRSGPAIEVGLPANLAQRECLLAVLSLTRSHTTRAVPFCEHPRELVLGLTRAVSNVLVFGDPGTLNRRSQWFGSLDHLDELTGPMEQALIGQLLALLPEEEIAGRPGRSRESSSV